MAEELATPNPYRGIGFVFVIAQPGVDTELLAKRIEAVRAILVPDLLPFSKCRCNVDSQHGLC